MRIFSRFACLIALSMATADAHEINYVQDKAGNIGDCPQGFIAVLCENDVDLGFVRNILLRQGLPIYSKIMKPIQD